MAEEKGFNVVQGCNKFDFKSDFVENVFENLPQLAWFQIFTGLLEHAKRADRRIWGHQRTTTEILTDYLPDNMKPALHRHVNELKLLLKDLEKDLVRKAKEDEAYRKKLASQSQRNFNKSKSTQGIEALEHKWSDGTPSTAGSPTHGGAHGGEGDEGDEAGGSTARKEGETGEGEKENEEAESELSPEALELLVCILDRITRIYPIMIVLHVRTGTSVYPYMDPDSWSLARLVAELAMQRRNELNEIRARLQNGGMSLRDLDRMPPPLVFVLNAQTPTPTSPQAQHAILARARMCSAVVLVEPLDENELAGFLAFLLKIDKQSVPEGLIKYVFSVTYGDPKIAEDTVQQLLKMEYLTKEDGKLEVKREDFETCPLSLSTKAKVQADLDRLQPDQQIVVKTAAATAKRQFDVELLRQTCPVKIKRKQMNELCDDLRENGIFTKVDSRPVDLTSRKNTTASVSTFHQSVDVYAFRTISFQIVVTSLVLEGQRDMVTIGKSLQDAREESDASEDSGEEEEDDEDDFSHFGVFAPRASQKNVRQQAAAAVAAVGGGVSKTDTRDLTAESDGGRDWSAFIAR